MQEKTKSSEAILDQLRKEIREIDENFVMLLSRRQEAAKKVVTTKMEHGIPLRNYSVENRVIERFAELCREHGLREQWGKDLADFLIKRSVELQSNVLDRQRSGNSLKVLVVGGMGKMGKWFCDFLNAQGHYVICYDTSPEISRFPRQQVLEHGVEGADIILVSVPLRSSPEILQEIITMKPSGIVVDVCSIKKEINENMKRGREEGLKVTSLHPLFGPEVTTLHGRNIVLCSYGDQEADKKVLSLFEETAANIIATTPEEHDRLMTMTLGISHAVNLTFAGALSSSGIAFSRLNSVASSTYSKQLATTLEVMQENMDLYFDIQRQCDFEEIFSRLAGEARTLSSLIGANKRQEFIEHIKSSRGYLEGCNAGEKVNG